ncbi:ABC transporter permease [Chitinimonas viridis]|uniref:ABC transporter permease n=2 Tax=Chitinimonas TaxID=240411 RepID=A0ABT8B2B5_9NEIS|nr:MULTISPECIES: ABC transporter permease [Chitinimonas]MDN3575965.1 ABC transporter permease [Chitinimonas viridis]GLR14253.1 ABC transporter permease [Chitinimonas prasina]
MSTYLLRRIWQMIPTLAGVMLLVFFLFNVFGGDPAAILAGKVASKEKIDAIREQLGLNAPIWVQLWIFVKQVFTFDFGASWSTNEAVSAIILQKAPVSLTVMLQVWLLDAIVAVTLAVAVAYKRGSFTDRAVMGICTAAMSISLLLYVVVGQWLLAYKLEWFPVLGWSDDFWTNVSTYAPLPILLLLFVSIAPSLRLYRSFVVEETGQDYARTARAKGASEHRVMFVHVLRNAAVPIVTNLALALPGLFVGSFLIEMVFSIPGLGKEIVNAVQRSDFPVIKAITVYLAMFAMAVNLLVDVLYKRLDPRVELK